MLFKKNNLGWTIVILLSLSPLLPWLFVMQPITLRFVNIASTMTSLGEILGLVGVTMFCLNIVLSIRLKIFEDYFGGMNRVYIAHHIFGGTAFIILLFHPLALASAILPYSLKGAALYLLPGDNWSINVGIATLLLTMSLLILTFFVNLPYQLWRFTHKFLGPAFFLASIHGFFISSDISRYGIMKIYMSFFFLLGLIAYTYKTLLGRYFITEYQYTVTQVKTLSDDIVELTLSPIKKAMNSIPGQFVFLRFKSKNVSQEVHPFSITALGANNSIIFGIKSEGDYTKTLQNLQVGDIAFLEGAFGRFSYQKVKNKNQIWIAGGIGITPFLNMAKSLTDTTYTIDLYYSVRTPEEATYLDELQKIAASNTHFRIFPFFSKTQGRLTAEAIAKTSADIIKKEFFICGPPPLMKSLKTQLLKLSVPKDTIHTEEFNLQ
jgi:predicted ferric reductase